MNPHDLPDDHPLWAAVSRSTVDTTLLFPAVPHVPVDREALRHSLLSLHLALAYAEQDWRARDAVDEQAADCRSVAAQLLAVADEIDVYRASPAYAALRPTTPRWQPTTTP